MKQKIVKTTEISEKELNTLLTKENEDGWHIKSMTNITLGSMMGHFDSLIILFEKA